MRFSFGGGLAAKRCEELGIALGAGGVGSGVASGVHAGGAAERGDDETGIVGENQAIAETRIVEGFSGGIFREAGGVFLERRESLEPRQQLHLNRADRRQGLRQSTILGELSAVGRREIQLNGRARSI